MSYQVLARKYRPRSFETLVGQEHVVRALTHALSTGRLHHAYLFTGTRGVGKTTLSRILAKSLNCTGPDGQGGVTAQPCGQCEACVAIDAGRFVDYIEMDAASNRGVDEMAQLLEQAIYAPSNARYKVYMIDEVHMLTNHAFNAMLKTLEEPPPHIKFILATTDPQKIPVTVLSRCLQFNLKQMPPGHIIGHLENILGQEGISFEQPALRLLAQGAHGSMRDALSLTDQAIAYAAGQVTLESVQGMLGALDQSYLVRLLDALVRHDGADMVAVADEMASRSLSYNAALQDLGTLLHRIALLQSVPSAVPDDLPERADIERLAGAFEAQEVQLYYQIVVHGRNEIGLAPDEYAGFTMTLLRMLAFRPLAAGEQASGPAAQGGAPSMARPGIAAARAAAGGAPAARPVQPPGQAVASQSPATQAAVLPAAVPQRGPAEVPGETGQGAVAGAPAQPAAAVPVAASPDAASQNAASQDAASQDAASQDAASQDAVTPAAESTHSVQSAQQQETPPVTPPAPAAGISAAPAPAPTPAPAAASAPAPAQGGAMSLARASINAALEAARAASRQGPRRPAPADGVAPAASEASGQPAGASPAGGSPAPHPAAPAHGAAGSAPAAPSAPAVSSPVAGARAAQPGAGTPTPDVARAPLPWEADTAAAHAGQPAPAAAAAEYDDQDTMLEEPPAWATGFHDDAATAAPAAPAEVRTVAPARAPAAPPSPMVVAPIAQIEWNGSWPELAASLPLRGVSQQLALQTELRGAEWQDGLVVFRLRVPVETLRGSGNSEKLCAALQERFSSCRVQVDIDIGPVWHTASAAAIALREKIQREAEATIASDPFVKDIIRDLNAWVVPGSVKPAVTQ